MIGTPIGQVMDLLTTTEAIGDDGGRWRRGLDRGHQSISPNGDRHLVVTPVETERSGETAAARVENPRAESAGRHGLAQVITVHERLLMAVHVHEGFTLEPRQIAVGEMRLEEDLCEYRS